MRPVYLKTHPIIFRVIWGLRKTALLALLLAVLFSCVVELIDTDNPENLKHAVMP
jgi:hypothetical protein